MAGPDRTGVAPVHDPDTVPVVVTLVTAVRVLGSAMIVPSVLAGEDAAAVAAALGLSVAVAALPHVLRHRAARSAPVRAAVLAADVLLVVPVALVGGPGAAAVGHALGSAALLGGVLGMPGAIVGTALGFITALATAWLPGAGGGALPLAVAAAVPAPFALVAILLACVRHVHRQQVALRAGMRTAAERAARADERARLARELHDSVAKTLAGIGYTASALRMSLGRANGGPDGLAAAIESAARRGVGEARSVIADLRSVEPGALAAVVRRVALAWGAEPGRPRVVLDVHDVREPVGPVRDEALSILREALTNAERHSCARSVRVGLHRAGDDVVLSVADDGRGFPVPADPTMASTGGHYGLLGMTERAERAGGRLHLHSRPGAGTTVTATLPAAGERPRSAVRAVPAVERWAS